MVLDALSKTLPDDTHLTEFRIEDGKVQMVGLAGDASQLIPLIKQSRQFTRATFFAPTVKRSERRPDLSHRGPPRAILHGVELTLTSISRSALVRRQFLAGAAYFGVVIALASGSLWFIDDLRASSGSNHGR